MITDIQVQDYQALHEVRLQLGLFTVITGPTGSGKSAVIRAVKLVVFNARGTSYIRHGVKACAAMVGFRGESLAVAIHRGGRGADKYRIARPGQPTAGTEAIVSAADPDVVEFTKLEGKVPAAVSSVLRLGELNFAGQFDRPYLLDATGGQVARVLGELTNVTLVFDAAREATRRKQETARELKRAEQELVSLREQAQRFRSLKARRQALEEARKRADGADYIADNLERLRKLAAQHSSLTQALELASRRLGAMDVPSLTALEAMQQRLQRLASLRESWQADFHNCQKLQQWEAQAAQEEEAAHQELHAMLLAAGACPTCGQAVSGLCFTAMNAKRRASGQSAWPGVRGHARCAAGWPCATTCLARTCLPRFSTGRTS